MMKKILFFGLLILCSGAPVRAEPYTELPESLRGLWAIADCRTGDMVQAISARFRLQTSGAADSISRLVDITVLGDDAARADVRAVPHEYRLLPGGRLGIYGSDGTKCIAPTILPERQVEGSFFPYERCASIKTEWGTMKQEGYDIFLKLDDIDRACYGKNIITHLPCQQAIVAAFDADKNSGLDGKETAAAFRALSYVAASQLCSFPEEFPAKADSGAAPFAAFALKNFDDDGNGVISVAEWVAHWPGIQQHEETKTIVPLIGQAGWVLTFMPHDPDAAPFYRDQKAVPVP